MKRIGTETALTDEERADLLNALSYWHRQVSDDHILDNRVAYEKAFNCVWRGQSPSGVREDSPDEMAWPFAGASDQRLRWGDKIYNDFLSLILISISSCDVEISCGGDPEGVERARALKLLLRSVMNSLGARGQAEMQAMFHYMLCDTPAVGALDVMWKKRVTMGVAELNVDELEAEYAAGIAAEGGAETDAAIDFRIGIDGQDEMSRAKVRSWLVGAKKIRDEDVDDVMSALSEDGECEAMVSVDENEGPEIKALRYGDDFCVPRVTDDFDYASPWFRGEWCTESQLKERIADQDWDPEWVNDTLNYRGQEFFTEAGTVVYEDVKDLVNIVWCYTAETNDRGETTRYVSVLSRADGSAFGKRVLKTRRGKWNTVFFRREVRNSNILDGRGIAELTAAPQGAAKAIRDMAANNAIVGSLPPVKAKGARVRNVLLEPFAVVNMGQSDDVTFMQPPAFPAAADKQEEKIKTDLLEYMGVSDGEKDVTERRRAWMIWFLSQWRDFLVLLLEVAQDNASDEYVVRATETSDIKGVKAQDVSGSFIITLKLDPTNLDNAKLIEKVQAASQVLQSMDRKQEVDTSPFVRHFFTMLFPEMAGTALKSPDQLVADDMSDEQNNFVKIKAGIMPQMDTSGKWNYEARLGFYRQLQEQNPDAISDMSPSSQEMLQRWISALEQQNTQYGQNAEIGKTGVEGISSN